MSLRRIKLLYCITVVAIAVILASFGQLIGWIAAVVVLAGALPMFGAVKRAAGDSAADETLRIVEHHLTHRDH